MANDSVIYHGREGRRFKGKYIMVHIIEIDGIVHEVQASTKEKAIEIVKNSLNDR